MPLTRALALSSGEIGHLAFDADSFSLAIETTAGWILATASTTAVRRVGAMPLAQVGLTPDPAMQVASNMTGIARRTNPSKDRNDV